MAKNRDNIRIYGDDASAVWVAPFGTTGPTTLAAPDPDTFDELGWLSDDGIDLSRDISSNTFYGYQGGAVVKTKKATVADTFHVICLEETATTLGLYYAGATPTTAAGVDTYTITNQTKSDPRLWVVDLVDGTITKRYVVPNGEVLSVDTMPHNNADLTVLDMTVSITGDYTLLKTAAA